MEVEKAPPMRLLGPLGASMLIWRRVDLAKDMLLLEKSVERLGVKLRKLTGRACSLKSPLM